MSIKAEYHRFGCVCIDLGQDGFQENEYTIPSMFGKSWFDDGEVAAHANATAKGFGSSKGRCVKASSIFGFGTGQNHLC